MKTLLSFYNMHKKNCCLAAGLILACLLMVPFLLLGTGSIITYHDQLDGELLNYILAARYLFTDIRIYPEIMNGLPVAGAVPPAPLFVLLYVIFEPFTAFILSQWILYLVAFWGMYLLLQKLTGQEFISFGISVIFMLLPFYPVYGLCIPGQPLLYYAVLCLYEKEVENPPSYNMTHPSRKFPAFFYYLLIVIYGAASSPVLVGFACMLVLGIFAVLKSVTAFHKKEQLPLSPWFSLVILLITYIVFNFSLVKQVLFPESTYVSHKTELVLSAREPLSCFREVFGTGISYAQSYPAVLIVLAGLCLVVFLIMIITRQRTAGAVNYSDIQNSGQQAPCGALISIEKAGSDSRSPFFRAAFTLLSIVAICLFTVFYHGSFMTELRNNSDGVLRTFNLDRVCWLLPTAWCILAAYLLTFVLNCFQDESGFAPLKTAENAASSLSSRSGVSVLKCILRHGIIWAVLGLWGIIVLLHSAIYPNLARLIKGEEYYALDWNNFFAEDIFSQIDTAIGKPKEDYRVVSIGIYPAAAAYNGFYCLDGYSNNYSLDYKHTFRQIIEGELDKSDYVKTLFDNWGNRCYITTAEQADYYTFEKKWNSVIYDLDLNTDTLKELNCQYVFSAAYLLNAEENGLVLLREAPFEAEGSWYHIYVYRLN